MSILATNSRLIRVGQDYSAGSGISIDDHVISVTGGFGKTYSAGDNVDIYEQDEQLYISSKDWANDIANASANAYNEAVAQIPDPFDPSYISGAIDNKLDESAFSNVSGSFLTAHQSLDGYATENWVTEQGYITGVDLSEYAKTNDVLDDINSAVSGKLDTTSFSTVSGDFLTAVDLSPYYTTAEANTLSSMLSGAIDYVSANAGGGGGDEEVNELVHSNSANWNEVSSKLDSTAFDTWQNGQYTTDLQTIEGQINNKLDESAFGEVSASFLTAINIPESATWNETTEVVQTNSAQWADGGSGDEEVNSFVYNNSATINEVNTAYQTHSASYQPSGNYIPYTGYGTSLGYVTNSSFSIHDGSFTNTLNRGSLVIQSRSTSNIYSNMAASPVSITFSTPSDTAKVDLPSINKWNEVSTTVQSNSAQWGQGGDEFPASANEAITAYQNASGTYLTAHQIIPSAKWEDASDCVQTNSASWGTGSTPTYDYTDNNLISAIDTSGLYATSADTTNHLRASGTMGNTISYYDDRNRMVLNPLTTPFGTTSGIYGPLYYATGAVITYGSSGISNSIYSAQYFGGFLKGNEWYISNANEGQALRGETHQRRGVHLSGTYEDGRSFDLSISGVSGNNDTANGYNWKLERGCVSGKGVYGEWRYGVEEDTLLRSVSSNAGGDMFTAYLEYNDQNQISGYNGSAFAGQGGGDVPEDVMVESAIGYNAVGEISAYGNSAIAQYGAEKQWLVHDDTLVHASNSAQYALGVNLSALQRLMGIDETVIYENTTGATVNSANVITLNESLQNFETIKIIDNSLAAGGTRRLTIIPVSTATRSIATNDAWFDVSYNPTGNGSKYIGANFYSANGAGTQIRMNGSYIKNMAATGAWTNRNDGHLYKIVGVHRISG